MLWVFLYYVHDFCYKFRTFAEFWYFCLAKYGGRLIHGYSKTCNVLTKKQGSTYTQVRLIHRKIQYRVNPCIVRTFFSQILPLKSRCALYKEPFVFLLGNLRNNTKSAKSNKSQFYATSRNKSRQKVCLALYITSVHVHHGISHATYLRSRLKICCIFSSISMTNEIS